MTAAVEFDELMSSLTLGAGKLRMEEIIALQKTLAEACRVHDPKQADEILSLLERMDVSESVADEASPLPREAEIRPEPMSVEPVFVPPRGQFELGVAEQKSKKPARQAAKKVARNLDPTLKKAVFEQQLDHRPVPPPPRKDKTVAPPPARSASPLKNLQFTFGAAAEKGSSSPSTKENRAPPPSQPTTSMDEDEADPPLFTLGKTEKVVAKKKKSTSPRKRISPVQRWQQPDQTAAPSVFSWDWDYEVAAKRYDEGDYERATTAYTAALESAPPNWALTAKALGNRGACNVMLKRYSEALFDCRRATKIDPTLYKAHNRLGKLELANGDHKAAALSFEAAKKHAGEKADRDAMQAAEVGLNDARRVAESLSRADASFARASKHAASLSSSSSSSRRLSSSSTSSSPGVDDDVEDQRTRAERSRDESVKAACRAECERAVRYADEALGSAPLAARAVLVKARALAKLERWMELEAMCVSFAGRLAGGGGTTKKDDEEDAKRRAGTVALALAAASKQILLAGHQHHLPEVYVICLRKLEQPEEQNRGSRADDALAALVAEVDAVDASCRERCRARLQRSSKLRRAKDRADSAYTRGHYRAAVAMYRDALMLDAEHLENDALRATLHFNLAAAALVLGRCVDAENHCSKALRLRPGYVRARLRRARARIRIDQPNAALADFDAYLAALKKSSFSAAKVAPDDSIERVTLERRKVELDLLRRRNQQQQRGDDQQKRSPFKSSKPPPSYQQQQQQQHHHQQRPEASVTRPLSSRSTHYSVLGLCSDCRPVDVKRAYAKLALQYHPDRNDDPAATATMARINEAYECLKDARLRSDYDTTIGGAGSRRMPARYRPGWAH